MANTRAAVAPNPCTSSAAHTLTTGKRRSTPSVVVAKCGVRKLLTHARIVLNFSTMPARNSRSDVRNAHGGKDLRSRSANVAEGMFQLRGLPPCIFCTTQN